MHRWRRFLAASIKHNCIKDPSLIIKREMSANMSDKFKLPARYGAGEKSVW